MGKGDKLKKISNQMPSNFRNCFPDQDIIVTVHVPDDDFDDSEVESEDEHVEECQLLTETTDKVETVVPVPSLEKSKHGSQLDWRQDPQFKKMLDEMVEERIKSRGIQIATEVMPAQLMSNINQSSFNQDMARIQNTCSNSQTPIVQGHKQIIRLPSESTIYAPALQPNNGNDI